MILILLGLAALGLFGAGFFAGTMARTMQGFSLVLTTGLACYLGLIMYKTFENEQK